MEGDRWKEKRQWIRGYLTEHPDASVDEIARQADSTGDGVPKEIISQVRRDFRLTRTYSVGPSPVIPSRPSAPRPVCDRCGQTGHWISQCNELPVPEPVQEYVPEPVVEPVVEQQEEEPPMEPVAPPSPPQKPQKSKIDVARSRTMEGTIARRKRLNEIVDATPDIHPMKAIVALREEFGIGLDFNYTYETIRVARELHGLPPLRTREDTEDREFGEREKVTLVEAEEKEAVLSPDDELEWIATRISEIVRAHNLSDVNIRTENGTLSWDYEIRIRKSGKKVL